MLYLYDNAIVEDLQKSFNVVDDRGVPVVRVISPDQIIGLAAQIQEDQIAFPIVALERADSLDIEQQLINFTRMHKGVSAVFDKKENNVWFERAIPINLSYTLTVLTTNQADMDELMREIIFKYVSMYFLSITIPYESNRVISFGVVMDPNSGIRKRSDASDYTESGKLYQSSILLNCEGCVLVHCTPQHLKRTCIELDVK